MRGLEHSFNGELLGELRWVRLEKRRLRADSIELRLAAPFNSLKGGWRQGVVRLDVRK